MELKAKTISRKRAAVVKHRSKQIKERVLEEMAMYAEGTEIEDGQVTMVEALQQLKRNSKTTTI